MSKLQEVQTPEEKLLADQKLLFSIKASIEKTRGLDAIDYDKMLEITDKYLNQIGRKLNYKDTMKG